MRLIYKESVLNVFEAEIDKFGAIETGGVLMGYTTSDVIVVTKAITAGPNAIHENFYFQADNNYVEMMIDMEYANSEGMISYLGEWHTHPQILPQPSRIDLNSIDEIAQSSNAQQILLILGAIGFDKSKFIDQSVSILKSPNNKAFFRLLPELG